MRRSIVDRQGEYSPLKYSAINRTGNIKPASSAKLADLPSAHAKSACEPVSLELRAKRHEAVLARASSRHK
jgi:hypothetical protein